MQFIFWVGFVALIIGLLTVDLKLVHKEAHEINVTEAGFWTALWMSLGLLFSGVVYYIYQHDLFGIDGLSGIEAMQQYLAGWLIEEALSVDNIFVFVLIFSYFKVPRQYQHRVLFWGIMGALVMRGIMIGIGTALVNHFEAVQYFFALLLLYAALKMLKSGEQEFDPHKNVLFRLVHRVYPVSVGYSRDHFFVTLPDGRRAATTLFVVLLVIESSDLLFAVDSVPAILGVSRVPFIIFTSNVFAILGLRSLYFVLDAMINKFAYLKYGVIAVLFFIAFKMLSESFLHISTGFSLAVVATLLVGGTVASLVVKGGVPADPPRL